MTSVIVYFNKHQYRIEKIKPSGIHGNRFICNLPKCDSTQSGYVYHLQLIDNANGRSLQFKYEIQFLLMYFHDMLTENMIIFMFAIILTMTIAMLYSNVCNSTRTNYLLMIYILTLIDLTLTKHSCNITWHLLSLSLHHNNIILLSFCQNVVKYQNINKYAFAVSLRLI